MIVGMNPYFMFNGQGVEAVRFYEEVLGAEVIEFKTYAELPDAERGDENLLLHANLKIGDHEIMISDGDFDKTPEVGNLVSIALISNNADETSDMFRRIRDEGGEEVMPLTETFFSPAYGKVKDKFGIEWQFSTIKDQE